MKAEFVKSSQRVGACPEPDRPEFACIGRSNVGKSSLINMLTQRKSLAKTSSTPGKTQLINHFDIDERWYLVDLPGYGYAQVSKKDRSKWIRNTWEYLDERENLYCLFVLLDMRLDPQQVDMDFIAKAAGKGIPIALILTKSDKLNRSQYTKNLKAYKDRLLKDWEELPPLFVTSSQLGEGRDEILEFIEGALA